MPKSIASQSHCFADWSFIVEWSHNIIHYHTCVQKPLEAPKMPNSCEWSERAGVGSLQSPSERSPKSSRRTAWRNHSDFQGAWKFWVCWYPFGYGALLAAVVRAWKNCPYFSNSHSDSRISVQTESIFERLTGCFSILCDGDVSFHFCRSGTNTAKLPEYMLSKKNARQRCPSSLRTVRLFPVSNENTVI